MTKALSTGLEKPCRFRPKGDLNEHLGRHETATGPLPSDTLNLRKDQLDGDNVTELGKSF
ncbi:MAG: hypothetical protein KC448_14015 [Yoonia sp.]|nr:hypothetical protein [Yoonia sp.]